MYIHLEKPNIYSHANCMQHVLRCWERQSDGSEFKKTLRRPGSAPDLAEGAYSAPANTLVGGGGAGCPLPKNPISRSRPFGPRLFYPDSKLVPTPLSVLTLIPTQIFATKNKNRR